MRMSPTFVTALAVVAGVFAQQETKRVRFERVDNELTREKFASTGSSWTDIDGDGHVDVSLSARDSMPSRVYRNLGGSRFERIPLDVDLRFNANTSAWGDIDGDGDPDLVLGQNAPTAFTTNLRNGAIRLERATNVGVLTEDALRQGGYEAIAFGDLDSDGDLDIIGGTFGWFGVVALINDGSGRYTLHQRDDFPYRSSIGGAHIVDLDGDGRIDIVFTGTQQPGFETGSWVHWGTAAGWLADRDLRFSKQASALGSSIADVDRDGDLDIFVAGWARDGSSHLYLNQGKRRFRESDLEFPKRTIGSAFGDIDNDGDLDLITASGYTDIGNVDVFLGDGAGHFTRTVIPGVTDQPGKYSGLTLVDFDRDGRLDLHINSLEQPGTLFRNASETGNGWFEVELTSKAGSYAIWGARVEATIESTRGRWTVTASVHQQDGYGGHGEPVAHFGLTPGARVRAVSILWPGGARTTADPVPGKRIVVSAPPLKR